MVHHSQTPADRSCIMCPLGDARPKLLRACSTGLLTGAVVVLAVLLMFSGDTRAANPDRDRFILSQNPGFPPSTPESAIVFGSGWMAINRGETITLTHDLGGNPDDYAVQLWFWDIDGGFGVNRRAYGGLEAGGDYYGAAWQRLTSSIIQVYRHTNDTMADMVRVSIWRSVPDVQYCSGWGVVNPGDSLHISHNLGGNPNNYTVSLWFKQLTGQGGQRPLGANHHAYGGMEDQGVRQGAYWHNLDADSVDITRLPDDTFADQVRVCVAVSDEPDYNSGWVALGQEQTRTLSHDLNHNVNRYVVRMEFRDSDPDGLGTHIRSMGGNAVGDQFVGANWQSLTDTTIDVYRCANDWAADQVRVRIWYRPVRVYLPVVEKRF